MWVARLELENFRNHSSTALDLTPGRSVFVGPNGHGKTNLIEGIGFLAYQSSHRVAQTSTLIGAGHNEAAIRLTLRHEGRSAELACVLRDPGANRAKVNGKQVALGELSRWLKVVVFSPEDLHLVRGEPQGRRRYLDSTLAAVNPGVVTTLSDYDRVVRQRNAFLKTHRGARSPRAADTLEGWNESLITLGAEITRRRRDVIQRLRPHLASLYSTISGGDGAAIELESPVVEVPGDQGALESAYRVLLEQRRADEWDRGVTLVGPHRDDLMLSVDGLPSRTHSSQGEAWSMALSLRMAQARIYREESQAGDPVVILDDVFAELDTRRRHTLTELVSDYEQVLVTVAIEEDVPGGFADRVCDVMSGEVHCRDEAGSREG